MRMRVDPSLLARLQRLIEQTYDWDTGIRDLTPFLLGDVGYQRVFSGREVHEEAQLPEFSPRTLVSWRRGRCRLNIYYPNSLVEHLETVNPLRELSERNVVAFSLLVEELDHLLRLAWSAN